MRSALDIRQYACVSTRTEALRFGAPIFVPDSPDAEWVVAGIDTNGANRDPVAVLVFGAKRDEWPSVRTSERGEDEPLFIQVANILSSSVRHGPVSLPLSITVTERDSDLLVDGEPYRCRILETESAWRATATVDGRVLSAAGAGNVPEPLAFARLTDLEAADDSRFR